MWTWFDYLEEIKHHHSLQQCYEINIFSLVTQPLKNVTILKEKLRKKNCTILF
jgi:ppGpp synthetase/RelA/SpoT-type nucleotidyltranferase